MGAAAFAGLGVDGFGVATVPNSGAGETGGKLGGAAGVSLVGSAVRATVSVGGVGVGSGARATGGAGGTCNGAGEAKGVAGSGVVACSCGGMAATDGITWASPGGWGAGVDRGSGGDPAPSAGFVVGDGVADGGDTGRPGLDFGGDVASRLTTPGEAVRVEGDFGAGSPITTSSRAAGAAAKTSHGGARAGRKPAVARNNENPAMCNTTEVTSATTSSNTGRERERVTVTAWARGAFFGVGGAVMSPGYGVAFGGRHIVVI